MSQEEIGRQLGFTQSSISRCFRRWADTGDAAKAFLQSQALPVAKKLMKTITTPEQATDLLERQGILAPKKEGNRGNQMAVYLDVGKIDGYDDPEDDRP